MPWLLVFASEGRALGHDFILSQVCCGQEFISPFPRCDEQKLVNNKDLEEAQENECTWNPGKAEKRVSSLQRWERAAFGREAKTPEMRRLETERIRLGDKAGWGHGDVGLFL